MKLNGIMRLRIVIAAVLWLATLFVWWSYIDGDLVSYLEGQYQEVCGVPLPPDGFRLVGPSAECSNIEERLTHAKQERERLIFPSVLWTALLPALFWILGSVIGWVYRGFKHSKATP